MSYAQEIPVSHMPPVHKRRRGTRSLVQRLSERWTSSYFLTLLARRQGRKPASAAVVKNLAHRPCAGLMPRCVEPISCRWVELFAKPNLWHRLCLIQVRETLD